MKHSNAVKWIITGLISGIFAVSFVGVFGLLLLRQNIFLQANITKQITQEIEQLETKNLVNVAQINQQESPQELKKLFQNTDTHGHSIRINIHDWKAYKGTFIDRHRLAMNVKHKQQ